MEKLHKETFINSPREKVWDIMLSPLTYQDWTSAFHPGSRYEGSWEKGAKILFIGPDEEGKDMGMVSRIAESKKPEFLSIEHIGIYKDGVEDTESEEAKKWAPAHENYTFEEKDGGTRLSIDMDIDPKEKRGFEEMWDKALLRLKELAEN